MAPQFSTVSKNDAAVPVRMLQASRRQDWNEVRECLHAEVVWTLPGTSMVSGRIEGREAVVEVAQIIDSANLTVQPLHIMTGFETVVVTIHNTANTPVDLDEWLALAFRVEDGLIVSIGTHLSDVPGLDRFYGVLAEQRGSANA